MLKWKAEAGIIAREMPSGQVPTIIFPTVTLSNGPGATSPANSLPAEAWEE